MGWGRGLINLHGTISTMFSFFHKKKKLEQERIIKKGGRVTKSQLLKVIQELGLRNFDLSSLPDNAVISNYELDITDPGNPILRITHTQSL